MTRKNKKAKITSKILPHEILVKKLASKYRVNACFNRIDEWCNYWGRKIRNKKLKSRRLLKAYYCESVWDVENYIKIIIRALAVYRWVALDNRFDESTRLEHKLYYVKSMISRLKEGAFEDELVIDTLTELRKAIYIDKIPIKEKQKCKETLESLLSGLKLDRKLTGKKDKLSYKDRQDMLELYKLTKMFIEKVKKKYRNICLAKPETKKIFPFLSKSDIDNILNDRTCRTFEGARIVLARLNKVSPFTVKDYLHKAKNPSR